MRFDHALFGLSLALLIGSIYLAGASLQITDLSIKLQTVTYATWLFYPAAILLALVITALLLKKKC